MNDLRELLDGVKPPLLLPPPEVLHSVDVHEDRATGKRTWSFRFQSGDRHDTTDPQEAQILAHAYFPQGPASNG